MKRMPIVRSRGGPLPDAAGALLLLAALLLGLPMLGAMLAGQDPRHYLEFPPLTRYRVPAPFSRTAFLGMLLFGWVLYLPTAALLRALLRGPRPPPRARFPAWGWLALLWTAAWWILAWLRLPAFAPVQQHTFTPLWLGYIALMQAGALARTGRCRLADTPRRFLLLFPASTLFWWFFEYLNRFVQNWCYEGIADFTPLRYSLFATFSFATVLPAVLSTADVLESLTPAGALTRCTARLSPPSRTGAGLLLAAGTAGLAGIGIWPDQLFPLVWIAPLLLLLAFQQFRGVPTVLAPAAQGNWRRIAILMTAALVCGLFWEMWNFGSLARWIYQVPFVGRFHLFEMPILGYTGYLPFGLECAVIADTLIGDRAARTTGKEPPCGSS